METQGEYSLEVVKLTKPRRPNPALTILVYTPWLRLAAIANLSEMGHVVVAWEDAFLTVDVGPLVTIDLILHPAAHSWVPEMFAEGKTKGQPNGKYPYVDAALMRARQRRKEQK